MYLFIYLFYYLLKKNWWWCWWWWWWGGGYFILCIYLVIYSSPVNAGSSDPLVFGDQCMSSYWAPGLLFADFGISISSPEDTHLRWPLPCFQQIMRSRWNKKSLLLISLCLEETLKTLKRSHLGFVFPLSGATPFNIIQNRIETQLFVSLMLKRQQVCKYCLHDALPNKANRFQNKIQTCFMGIGLVERRHSAFLLHTLPRRRYYATVWLLVQ